MNNKKFVAIALVALSSTGAGAESLPQVVERAITRNPEVAARLHSYQASDSAQEGARGGLRPRIDLTGRVGEARRDAPGFAADTFSNPSASIELRQLLFDGSATKREVRRLGHVKATRFYELLAKSNEIALDTSRAYIDVQRYRELGALAKENYSIHREIYDKLSARAQSGVTQRVDLEQASGRLALAESNWVTETSNLHDVGARYLRLVGELPADALDPVPPLASAVPGEGDVIRTAVTNNPNFLAAVSNLRAARAFTDAARSTKSSPTVEFLASHGAEKNRLGVSGTEENSFAGVVLNYNLYRGGRDKARVAEGESRFSEAVDLREVTCRNIRQDTAISYNDTRRIQDQLKLLEAHVASTQRARDAYRQQFDIGRRTLLDLLDTENELFQARRALTNARGDLAFAQARVLANTNGLLPALGVSKAATEAPSEAIDPEDPADTTANCDMTMPAMAQLDLAPLPPRPTPVAAPTPAPKPAEQPSQVVADCEATIRDWAATWAARDYDKYMNFYSKSFKPMTRRDQSDWRNFRNRRLNKPSIQVELENLTVRELSATTCDVKFTQNYTSPDYSDRIEKILTLKNEGGQWRIIRERGPRKSSSN